MTREEARMMLEVWATNATGESATGNEYAIRSLEALNMAIEALQERPNNDEIILQLEAEIDSITKYIHEYDGSIEQIAYKKGLNHALKIVKEMSQEKPKGRWIDKGVYITTDFGKLPVRQCTHCIKFIAISDYDNFCPNCGHPMETGGADMRESE